MPRNYACCVVCRTHVDVCVFGREKISLAVFFFSHRLIIKPLDKDRSLVACMQASCALNALDWNETKHRLADLMGEFRLRYWQKRRQRNLERVQNEPQALEVSQLQIVGLFCMVCMRDYKS